MECVNKNEREAVDKLDYYLKELIDTKDESKIKKAQLISYWIKDYCKYLKAEETYNPKLQENYKRGDVIKVNLGFNIGNEEGGLHYAIVVNNPTKSSGTVTIIPLTSKKENAKYNSATVNLGYDIIKNLEEKLLKTMEQLLKIQEELNEDILEKTNKTKNKELNKIITELNKYIKESKKLKLNESIALVGNIVTVSKQRIYTPTIQNKFLKGVKLSEEQLDLIDKKIIELYTKPSKI